VCLKCFSGGCTDQALNHSRLHFQQHTHPIALNIQLIERPQSEPIKVDKLAVGMPGGIDNDKDLWETVLTLKCLSCEKVLDHADVRELILANY